MKRKTLTGAPPGSLHQFMASLTSGLVQALDLSRAEAIREGRYSGPDNRTAWIEHLLWDADQVKRTAGEHKIRRAERPKIGRPAERN